MVLKVTDHKQNIENGTWLNTSSNNTDLLQHVEDYMYVKGKQQLCIGSIFISVDKLNSILGNS
jgi:hypothetical protein